VSERDNRRVAEQFYAAVNNRDFDAMTKLVDDSFVRERDGELLRHRLWDRNFYDNKLGKGTLL
jgi:hypothetical protein